MMNIGKHIFWALVFLQMLASMPLHVLRRGEQVTGDLIGDIVGSLIITGIAAYHITRLIRNLQKP